MVADNPDQKIELKMFHAEIVNDHAAIKAEEEGYVALPKIRKLTQEDIEEVASANKPKMSNPKRKSKQPQKKSLSL